LSLDIGTKRVGVAVSDELHLTARTLPLVKRTNWKRLLIEVSTLVETFDAKGMVLGLPLRMDGTEGSAAEAVRRLFRNFQASLNIPVFLQDERLTSQEASKRLLESGKTQDEVADLVDSEAAKLILEDFLSRIK
jgi:putative Holliday junction resolvase